MLLVITRAALSRHLRLTPPAQPTATVLGCRMWSTTFARKVRKKKDRVKRRMREGVTGSVIPEEKLPTVTLVGRPNVGKSRLFNRLVQKRLAIVNETAGTTRDFREAVGGIGDVSFRVIDTAGLEDTSIGLEKEMMDLTKDAIATSSLVLFLIDGLAGVTPIDQYYARWMKKQNQHVPCVLAVNKIDRLEEDEAFYYMLSDCERLGFGSPVFISGENGHGMGDLYQAFRGPFSLWMDTVAETKPPCAASAEGRVSDADLSVGKSNAEHHKDEGVLQIAVVGKPNVGKSTLLNTLLKSNRVLTGPMAGVTRDSVRVDWEYGGQTIRLIDTAGIRRIVRTTLKSKSSSIEQWSAYETSHALRYAHVVLLVFDASNPPTRDDKALIGQICEEGRGLIILANKCDVIEDEAMELKERHEVQVDNAYQFVQEASEDLIYQSIPDARGAPVLPISALSGLGTDKIMAEVLRVYERWNARVNTGTLNRWLKFVQMVQPPPGKHKIKYGTQVNIRPPSFTFFVRHANKVPEHYVRSMASMLKEEFDLEGIAIRVNMKEPSKSSGNSVRRAKGKRIPRIWSEAPKR